jgi:hypothetical protein
MGPQVLLPLDHFRGKTFQYLGIQFTEWQVRRPGPRRRQLRRLLHSRQLGKCYLAQLNAAGLTCRPWPVNTIVGLNVRHSNLQSRRHGQPDHLIMP